LENQKSELENERNASTVLDLPSTLLTEEIEVIYAEKNLPTEDEAPTFGIVDDGRTYPAVSVRRRQHKGSKRSTLYTVSKNGAYSQFYEDFWRQHIEPYQARKIARQQQRSSRNSLSVNTVGTVDGGFGETWARQGWEYSNSITVSDVG
jgi:hypothetical protein